MKKNNMPSRVACKTNEANAFPALSAEMSGEIEGNNI